MKRIFSPKNLLKIFIISILLVLILIHKDKTWSWTKNIPNQYSDSRHNWNDSYSATFEMMQAENDYIGIGIKNNIYSKEVQETIETFLTDKFNLFYSSTSYKPEKKLNFYFLDKSIQDQIYVFDSSIYCSIDDINSDEFFYDLVSVYFNITQPWKVIGFIGYLKNVPIENDIILTYYEDADNLNMLSLFAGRFLKDWSTIEDYEMAFMTSYSYTEYLIRNYSIVEVLSEDMKKKQEWLEYIGINKEYDYSCEIPNILSYSKDQEYSLIVKTTDSIYYFKQIDNYFTNAIQMEELIHRTMNYRNYLTQYLLEHAPINFKKLNTESINKFYLRTGLSASSVNRVRNEINLSFGVIGVSHEMVHKMIPYARNEIWLDDGLAEYLSSIIYPEYEKKEWYYNTMCLLSQDDDMKKYYLEYNGSLANVNDFNMRIAIDAYCYAKIRNPLLSWENTHYRSPVISEIYQISNENKKYGDELTYFQACSFVNYLVNEYSLDTVIGFCMSNESYEEYFGASYLILKENWLEKFNSEVKIYGK